jgi:hypothetical protein
MVPHQGAATSSRIWMLPNTPRVLCAITQLLALPELDGVDIRRNGDGWALTVTVPKTPSCQRLPGGSSLRRSQHPTTRSSARQ